mmetsp:Transcript_21201/g.27080  ORF Transcript_21201/g.27080 Transcript_21201/m.27080 type:complete len:92 (+) Transcript_21201:168-443(+)
MYNLGGLKAMEIAWTLHSSGHKMELSIWTGTGKFNPSGNAFCIARMDQNQKIYQHTPSGLRSRENIVLMGNHCLTNEHFGSPQFSLRLWVK